MSEGRGCAHDLCLFERHCLVLQSEVEALDAFADAAFRRERGRVLAAMFGLSEAEAALFTVVLYSSDLTARIKAGDLLTQALEALADAMVGAA